MALSSIVPDDQNQVPDFRSIVYLVKGPKNSGKSTFARTLANRLSTRSFLFPCAFATLTDISRYQKVAFLECDVGQSEFTPGGMVSLNIVERPLFGTISAYVSDGETQSLQARHSLTQRYPTPPTMLAQRRPNHLLPSTSAQYKLSFIHTRRTIRHQ
jgi:hypothetical protein